VAESKYEPKALLEIGGTSVLLPVDEAIATFKMLCAGDCVQYSWEKKGYKRIKPDSHASAVSLKMFSITDYASLALNSTDE